MKKLYIYKYKNKEINKSEFLSFVSENSFLHQLPGRKDAGTNIRSTRSLLREPSS